MKRYYCACLSFIIINNAQNGVLESGEMTLIYWFSCHLLSKA